MSDWTMGDFSIQKMKIEVDRHPMDSYLGYSSPGSYRVRVTLAVVDVVSGEHGPVVHEQIFPKEVPEEYAVPRSVWKALDHEMYEWLRRPDGSRVKDPHANDPKPISNPGVMKPVENPFSDLFKEKGSP